MQFEEQIAILAPAEKVFSLYADVAHWSSWDHDVINSSIDGNFSSGKIGTLQASKGKKNKNIFH
ncbi:MAG: SRPBCC family protein [Acidithiobacillus sp.]